MATSIKFLFLFFVAGLYPMEKPLLKRQKPLFCIGFSQKKYKEIIQCIADENGTTVQFHTQDDILMLFVDRPDSFQLALRKQKIPLSKDASK